MEFVGMTLYGECRYIHYVDEKCTIYCTRQKYYEETYVKFIVGQPEGYKLLTMEESQKYRLGIEGDVIAYTVKHPEFVLVNFYEKDADFADFYTEDGQLIKKVLMHDKRFWVYDGDGYYEATSDAKHPSRESHETIISKDEGHKYQHYDIVSEKERFANIFFEIFKSLRYNP